MNVRRLLVAASVAGLAAFAPAAVASADVPSGSSGTGSSTMDSGSAAIGSAQLTQTGSAGGSFRNCDEARAAGRAPLFRGEDGYGPHLDPDGDGFACPTV